jgi:RNA polymerase sigma-70 factor (ECF subfamily)
MSSDGEITRLLGELRNGSTEAADRLFTLFYDELHSLAASRLRGKRWRETLRPTALVADLYVEFIRQGRMDLADKRHFVGTAAYLLDQLLCGDHRRRNALKRGDGWRRITLANVNACAPEADSLIIDLDRALDKLRERDERLASVVTLRMAGFTQDEVAEELELSARQVRRDWLIARLWLRRELGGEGE